MRIFGGEQIAKIMDFLKIDENQPIEHSMVGKSIESAQVKVEGFFFDQRKRLVEFDDVMNKHREIIYKRRRRLLEQAEAEVRQETVGEPLEEQIKGFLEKEIHALVGKHLSHDFADEELDALVKEFITIIPFDNESQKRLFKDLKNLGNEDDIADRLLKIVDDTYSSRERVLGKDQLRNLEKMVVLSTIDEKWMDHLDEVESLRE